MQNIEIRGQSFKSKTRNRITKLQDEILYGYMINILKESHPLSLRNVFYRCVTDHPEIIPKTELGYRMVQYRLLKLRRNFEIPYSWVSDLGRAGYHVPSYASAAEYLAHVKSFYRQDLWSQTPYAVEVWCESRSIGGIILPVCRELAVSLYATGGFTSPGPVNESALEFNDLVENYDKKPRVLVITDYDPAGKLIAEQYTSEYAQHLTPAALEEIEFIQVALTLEQVIEYELPSRPRKPSDKRVPEIKMVTESEAMPGDILRQLLRAQIEQFIPERALRQTQIVEAEEARKLDLVSQYLKRQEEV